MCAVLRASPALPRQDRCSAQASREPKSHPHPDAAEILNRSPRSPSETQTRSAGCPLLRAPPAAAEVNSSTIRETGGRASSTAPSGDCATRESLARTASTPAPEDLITKKSALPAVRTQPSVPWDGTAVLPRAAARRSADR